MAGQVWFRKAVGDRAEEASAVPHMTEPDITAALASSPARRTLTPLASRVFLLDLCCAVLSAATVAASVGGLSLAGLALSLTLWFIGLNRLGGYDERILVESPLRGWTLFSAVGRVSVLVAIVPLLYPSFPATSYVALLALTLLVTTLGRDIFARWVRHRQALGYHQVPAVVRGPAADIKTLMTALSRDAGQPFCVVAVQATEGRLTSDLTVASERDPVEVAHEVGAATVMLVGPQSDTPDSLRRTVWMLESAGIQVAWVPIASSLALPHVLEIGYTGIPALTFEDRDLAPERSSRKVIVDATVSFFATMLLAPVILAIACAIKLDSPGPVLFRQTRVGRGGRTFTMYKFRTMHDGAERELEALAEANIHEGGTLFKIPDDPRVTRVGKWLRKYSLDELPQLFNILRAEMSLVGPRPPLPGEVSNYPDDLHRRFLVRPGLTGLWQVSGRSDLDPVESARLDAYYVEHWSPMMDTRILVKTVKVVLLGDGAY
jgi:exopolysaccharide biosynthesis polyprenyl glycosylphosphotransferase